ncbi:hypothetical protein ACERZ8_07805 [Tateyamaria armeniaca]|uniref:OmpA-like domain-containing protein n=1 Tax=Tateyamaria armeniaca TaxID=2518930 RepID=A0ABW8UUP1_9RHOB
MFNRAERQQKSIAQLRAKGLTLAQANSFASKQRSGARPVVLLVALAGVTLMGAGGYAAYQGTPGAEQMAALTDVGAAEVAATPTVGPQVSPAEVVAPAAPDPSPVFVFATPDTPPAQFDWREASLLASGAMVDEIEPAEPQVAAPDCVDDLRAMASETVLFFGIGATQPVEMDVDALLRMDEAAADCPAAKIVVAGHSDLVRNTGA